MPWECSGERPGGKDPKSLDFWPLGSQSRTPPYSQGDSSNSRSHCGGRRDRIPDKIGDLLSAGLSSEATIPLQLKTQVCCGGQGAHPELRGTLQPVLCRLMHTHTDLGEGLGPQSLLFRKWRVRS